MVPLSLVPALALLFFYVSTFRSMCAVPNMAVFCSSLMSWFPGMSLTYFLNDLEMVPVAPIIIGFTLVFTFHMRSVSIVSSLYFKIFSASFLIIFLSPGIATSINMHVPFSMSRIITSGLLLVIVLSVCPYWFHSIVTLPSYLLLLILVHVRTSVFCPVAPLFPCMCWSVFAHSLYRAVLHIVLLPVLGMLLLLLLLF